MRLIVPIFCLISLSFGSPLSGLYNGQFDIEETKYKIIDNSVAFVPIGYRLPNNSIPLSYDLMLTTDIDRGIFNFTGHVKIHIKIIEESDEIVLQYRQTTIEEINLLSADGTTLIPLLYDQIEEFEFLVITLPSLLQPEEEIVLEIEYTAEHRTDGGGFYRYSYNNSDGELIWYAATQAQIDDARHIMPCYDEPGIRAPINVTIKHGKVYTAIANTDVESIIEDGDYFITKFLPTPSMQTYLLAFLVSDFDYVNATNSRIPQRIFSRPEVTANGEYAASVVGPMLDGLERYFEIDYPLTKMDHAGVTLFSFGAMENFGLITYNENALLYDPSTPPASQESRKMSVINIVAHEYIHQWFGNMVSPAWWSYTWLNEGFATLFASYISSLIYPEMNFMDTFVTSNMPRAFTADVLSSNSWYMSQYTEGPNSLWTKFNTISYQKSGCVLRMFQEALTPPTFAKGLTYYLRNRYMQAAIPDDLHEGLQTAYDEDYPGNDLNIADVMQSWENTPGYPIIEVTSVATLLVFTQRRYPDSAGELYSVPITLATKSNPDFAQKSPTLWITTLSRIVPQSQVYFTTNDWIILNIDQVGYYRVSYDTNLWRAIIRQLIEDHSVINPINRAVLQDEIYLGFSDTSLNTVAVTDCLDILSYFDGEDEPITWSKANTLLNLFNSRLFGTSRYEDFLGFLNEITTPHLTFTGYEPVDFEPSSLASLRSSIKPWNCLALNEGCLNHEREKLLQFFNTGTSAPFDYCYALRNIDEEYFEIVDGVASNAGYPSRLNYLANLGCSLSKEHVRYFLDIALDSSNILVASERQNVLTNTMIRSVVALETTIEFIDENYAELNTLAISMSTVLQSMTALINSEEYVEKLESLITKVSESGIVIDTTQIRNIYGGNMQWQNQHFQQIDEWFEFSQSSTTGTTTIVTDTTPTITETTTIVTETTPAVTETTTTVAETTTAITESTTEVTESTTIEPTTTEQTPNNANSVAISLALFTVCLIFNL